MSTVDSAMSVVIFVSGAVNSRPCKWAMLIESGTGSRRVTLWYHESVSARVKITNYLVCSQPVVRARRWFRAVVEHGRCVHLHLKTTYRSLNTTVKGHKACDIILPLENRLLTSSVEASILLQEDL